MKPAHLFSAIPPMLALFFLLAPPGVSAQTPSLLSAPRLAELASACAGGPLAATSRTHGRKLLLLDASGAVAAAQAQLPVALRANGFADSGVLVCIGEVQQQLELCEFNVLFSLPRVRRDYQISVHALRIGNNAAPLNARISGSDPVGCSHAGSLNTGQTMIAGELPDAPALLAALAGIGLAAADADADGYSSVDEFLLGSDAANGLLPGPTATLLLNGETTLSLVAGEPLTVTLSFQAGEYFLDPADYFLSIVSATSTLAYIHPGQLRPTQGRELAMQARALRFDDLQLLTLRDLPPGDHELQFAALIDGRVEVRASARVTITPARWQFTDVTTAAGFTYTQGYAAIGTGIARDPQVAGGGGVAAGDYDNDGWVDLYVTHGTIGQNLLFKNLGDGTFADVAAAAGAAFTGSYSGALFADYDGDGYLDLLLTGFNGTQIKLRHNSGSGAFTDVSATAGIAAARQSFGAAVADYDHDGDLDWFVSSIYDYVGPSTSQRPVSWGASGNRLYQNQGGGTFVDVTGQSGTRIGNWGWGSCFADFNNAHPDFFHVNGYTGGGHDSVAQFVNDHSPLFIANGAGEFTNRARELGLVDDRQGRGIVCFDHDCDRDGYVDIFIANNEQAPRLYRNDGGNQGNFLHVAVEGEERNAQAIGARIYVTANGVTQMRELQAGNNYLSQNPVEAYFGLGLEDTVDELRVQWPSGATRYTDVAANRLLLIEHPFP